MATITTSPYVYASATTFTASMANSNFAHCINACTDGTIELYVASVDTADDLTQNGSTVLNGAVTFNGRHAHNINPTTATCYSIGSTAVPFNYAALGPGVSAAITPGTGVVYGNNTTKAWLYRTTASSVVAFNLTQTFVTANQTYRLTFLSPMYDANYCVVVTDSRGTAPGWIYVIYSQATAYFDIQSWIDIGAYTNTASPETTAWSVVVYGNQSDPTSTA